MSVLLSVARVLMTVFILFGLNACSSKEYYEFTPEQSEFLAYEKGQILKFTDTSNVTHVMEQTKFLQGYYEHTRLWGTDFVKEYEVDYQSTNDPSFILKVFVNANHSFLGGGEGVRLAGYQAPSSYSGNNIRPSPVTLTVNGKVYTKVQQLWANEWGKHTPTLSKPATMHFNKEFGLIQLTFPNGKAITRVD